jgi:hypothetical protein
MKLQCLQNNVLHITSKFPWSTPIHDKHVAFQIPNVYIYIHIIIQATDLQNNENTYVHNTGQDEAQGRKYNKTNKLQGLSPRANRAENISGLNLAVVWHMAVQVTKLPL